MLEPERQGLAKSHYAPLLQIVPKQEDISGLIVLGPAGRG